MNSVKVRTGGAPVGVDTHDMLVFRVGSKLCALPLPTIKETLRPLPVHALAAAPPFVLGVTMLRGAATPVIDAQHLLSNERSSSVTRFISLKLGERRVALAVEAIIGVRHLDAATHQSLPPLLADVSAQAVSNVTRLDGELLLLLESASVFHERAST